MDKKRIEEVLKTKTLADISEKYNDVYIKNKEQKEQKKKYGYVSLMVVNMIWSQKN